LETTVSDLNLALEAERRERAALPGILVPKAAETQRGLNTLEKNFTLTMQAMDALGPVTGYAAPTASRQAESRQ
jgi:hypothetical protein